MIIDASVALKAVLPGEAAGLDLGALWRRDLSAPRLLRQEAANILWREVRRKRMDISQARRGFEILCGLPIRILDLDLESAALQLALDLGHPVYDCVYLAMAIRRGDRLLTADAEFLRAVDAHPYLAGQAISFDKLG